MRFLVQIARHVNAKGGNLLQEAATTRLVNRHLHELACGEKSALRVTSKGQQGQRDSALQELSRRLRIAIKMKLGNRRSIARLVPRAAHANHALNQEQAASGPRLERPK